jgi:type IV fimbrial biogenesis protein FimT
VADQEGGHVLNVTLKSRLHVPRLRQAGARGFSLIEIVITMALLGILLRLAAPSFGEWVRNSQVRTVADSLQNGVRLAQAEAVRRNRQVVFFLTNSTECTNTTPAAAGGAFWSIREVPVLGRPTAAVVQCGVVSDVAAGVELAGPDAICFNSMGRQTANADPGLGGAACTLAASGRSTYDVTKTASRPLRVVVSIGGQLRMCDPARTLSDSAPDGCPT